MQQVLMTKQNLLEFQYQFSAYCTFGCSKFYCVARNVLANQRVSQDTEVWRTVGTAVAVLATDNH